MTNEPALEEKWQESMDMIRRVKDEIGQVIVGQERVVEQLLICLLAGGHALFEGVPGLGKTLLVRTVAQCFDLPFSRIQFTPDLMPADIVGTNIITTDDAGKNVFQFQAGPVFGSLVLADEINRATPKTQSALLEAMQEHTVTVGGKTRSLPEPFFVLATQNPLEAEGTYPLPEAQMDRFLLKIVVDFPAEDELVKIVSATTTGPSKGPQVVADGSALQNIQALTRDILPSDEIVRYAVKLLLLTHPDRENAPDEVKQYIRTGAGPRGVQALVQAAKARAFVHERFNVAFEDIQAVAYPCLRHRILLNFEAEATGIRQEQIIDAVLQAEQDVAAS